MDVSDVINEKGASGAAAKGAELSEGEENDAMEELKKNRRQANVARRRNPEVTSDCNDDERRRITSRAT